MTDEEKDVLTEETLINEILSELKIELEVESEQDILLLQSKIKGAVREVMQDATRRNMWSTICRITFPISKILPCTIMA